MEWISVNDRLPNKYFDVILVDIDKNTTVGFFDINNQSKIHAGQKGVIDFENVTHWMPLPAPPNS